MKKLLKIILVIVVLFGVLFGCDSEEKPVSTNGDRELTADISTTDSPEEETKASEKTQEEITIAETVVYDENNVKITAVALEENWTGLSVKLLVENNTDKNIALSGSDIIVNGVTMTGGLYIDVAAGMKAYGTLDLYYDGLNTAGIEKVAVITAQDACLYDTDSYDILAETPFALVTSVGSEYDQVLDESGDIIFESNGVTVIAKVISQEFYGNAVVLYVKNQTGKNITVEAENISVNGFTIEAWMYDTVYADTVRFCDLDLYASGMEENGIDEIENVTFTINVIDTESYERIAVSDLIQIFVGE